MNTSLPPGVYLVGGGPGDPGLLTRRGADILARADVILYDRLVNPALLELAPPRAERVFVGKAPHRHTCPQEEINRQLIAHARAGKVVVRLHGGDPFVFGRGGEEIVALAAAGVPFEVVPGVTSAVAVPASAGIPLTHRDYAASFAVITGHRRADVSQPLPPLPKADTLVFLMPVGNLAVIVERLLETGYPPRTPAALIHNGTLPDQHTVTGNLTNIVTRAAGITPPAVLVVGKVVEISGQNQIAPGEQSEPSPGGWRECQ
ncbi:MAG: uroporphyrinogen-III C-methyltransferase [Caldilineae bacterium]|nr:MAG: uroporphyrinogen-III C-methyltransferase [Caldilineae bacterium]